MQPIPVIDLFAGPGGLGEGFSSLRSVGGDTHFKINLSIEKDRYAHSTLELRAFFRQFDPQDVPVEYYKHLQQEMTREQLYDRFPAQASRARREAWLAELGCVNEEEVRNRVSLALQGADPWVLIGGPPCQAYSVVGRSRNRGIHSYVPERDHRQTLYEEYLRVIADHWPAAFVMENVKGLMSARLNGTSVFARISADLQSPAEAVGRFGRRHTRPARHHYTLYSLTYQDTFWSVEPGDYVVRAEQHGVPQARHRLILFGIRDDCDSVPPQTLPFTRSIPLCAVLEGLPRVRSGLSNGSDTADEWIDVLRSARNRRWLAGARAIAGEEVRHEILDQISRLSPPRRGRGAGFLSADATVGLEPRWFLDKRIGGVCNHQTKAHMPTDLHRYLYASCFAHVHGRSPRLRDFPAGLMPTHLNAARAAKLGTGMFADRFRVQLRNSPATTITSHIHKDGHYYIHYDASQCRSLTVREAARAQTFPDNYLFCGPRTQQFIQVGNAVPPLLAREIARITWKALS